jgi:ribosomal protein S18 acetylase RimI-like enzyme
MSAIETISKEELLEHLTLLDEEASRWRFGYAISDAALEMYVNGIPNDDVLLGIRASITSPIIVGAMHLSFDKKAHSAEMGISTLSDYRRKGYAERLMRYSVDILRNRGITQLYSVCLPDNAPLLKLLQKLNITTIYSNDGDKEARVVIPMAGIDSVLHEMQNQRLVIIDKTMRPWAELWSRMFTLKIPNN